MRSFLNPVFSFVLVSLLTYPALSQQTEPTADESSTTIVSTTRLVTLDAVVTDAAGQPVTNLKKEDFTVLEDGKPQDISVFESPDVHLASDNKGDVKNPLLQESENRPRTIIVLDQMNTRFADTSFARRAIQQFVAQNNGRLQQPTALMSLTNLQLVLVHDYTQDGGELAAALERLPAILPWRVESGTDLIDESERFAKTFGAMHDIAVASAGYAGRKNVIWLGTGFTKLPNVVLIDNSLRIEQAQRLSNLLMESHTTLFTIDPAGLQVTIPQDLLLQMNSGVGIGSAFGHSNFGLDSLALLTGGDALYDRNDLRQGIETDVTNGNAYYTLAYYPKNRNWDGALRKIKVRVRPGLKVHTRFGYYGNAAPAPPTQKEIRFALARALENPLTYTEEKLQAELARSPGSDGNAEFSLRLDTRGLSWQPLANNDRICRVTVVIAALSRDGEILNYALHDVDGTITSARFDLSKTVSFKIEGPVPAKTASIRIIVRDYESGKIGSANIAPPETPRS